MSRPVSDDTLQIIEEIKSINDEIKPPLTVRQVYYQLATRLPDLVPLTHAGYSKAQRILLRVRERGIVPWESFADRSRERIKPSAWDDAADFAKTIGLAYRKDLWTTQPDHVEFWLEKDALSGFVAEVLDEYHVPLYVARGYPSATFVHEAAAALAEIDKPKHIYYLGDHDASGKNIEEVLKQRLGEYGAGSFSFSRVAIHLGDIEKFDLRPMSAKEDDTRYGRYVSEHGTATVELDALPPDELRRRIRAAVAWHIDGDEWRRLGLVEQVEQETIAKLARRIGTVKGDA